jgi:hypothetical protein
MWRIWNDPWGATALNDECAHSHSRCLNHYDTYRKYLCVDCGAVYMCACELLDDG